MDDYINYKLIGRKKRLSYLLRKFYFSYCDLYFLIYFQRNYLLYLEIGNFCLDFDIYQNYYIYWDIKNFYFLVLKEK